VRMGSACTWKEECGSMYGGRIVNELAGGNLCPGRPDFRCCVGGAFADFVEGDEEGE